MAPPERKALCQDCLAPVRQFLREANGWQIGVTPRAKGKFIELGLDGGNNEDCRTDLVHVIAVKSM